MKTCEEWSLEFDLKYNNIASNKAPGLTEYEKSIFLTRAQESVVVSLYRGGSGVAFESNEELTTYLATLVREETVSGQTKMAKSVGGIPVVTFPLSENMLFRTFESCTINVNGKKVVAPVIPVTQDEYWRTVSNPFKRQNKRRVLRLTGNEEEFVASELISNYVVEKYTYRYLSKPEPIVLEDVPDGYPTISGVTKAQTCKLPESIHSLIVSEAVTLARSSWAGQ